VYFTYNIMFSPHNIMKLCGMNTNNVSSWKNFTAAIGFFLRLARISSGNLSTSLTWPGHQQEPSFTHTTSPSRYWTSVCSHIAAITHQTSWSTNNLDLWTIVNKEIKSNSMVMSQRIQTWNNARQNRIQSYRHICFTSSDAFATVIISTANITATDLHLEF